MKTLIKHIIILVLTTIMVMCFILSVADLKDLEKDRKTINIYCDNKNISLNMVQAIREEENKKDHPIVFTSWIEEEEKTILNPELNRSTKVNSILINGDSSLLVRGTILFEDDKEGCLIDEVTAYKLFGDKDIVGKSIKYEERELEVRGIHKGAKETIFMETLNKSDEKINGITVEKRKEINITTFTNNYGLSENIVYSSIYYNFYKISVILLPTIVLIKILIKIIKKIIQAKNKYILQLIYTVSILLLITIFLKVIDITIPLEIIPNNWSDFEFWGELYEVYNKKIKFFLYMKKYSIDIYMIEYVGKGINYSFFALITFFLIRSLIKKELRLFQGRKR